MHRAMFQSVPSGSYIGWGVISLIPGMRSATSLLLIVARVSGSYSITMLIFRGSVVVPVEDDTLD